MIEPCRDDPEWRRIITTGELRSFNPFEPTTFEPKIAARVVQSYIQRANAQLRVGRPASWLQRVCFWWVDSCSLSLSIHGFGSVPPAKQHAFRSAITEIPGLMAVTLEYE